VLVAACGPGNGDNPDPDAGGVADAETASDAESAPDGAPGDDGGPGVDAGQPWVELLEPADGATVDNPVTFRVAASVQVVGVRILADDWPLSEPWDPHGDDTLEYTFSGVGFERVIRLEGLDGLGPSAAVLATDSITLTAVDPDPGTYHGAMWNTYYYLAEELDYAGADDTTLYDASCNPIADVPAAFSDDVCIEGSGLLADQRVINYATTCSCGRPCPYGSNPVICYVVLDPAQYPWGAGSFSNPLEPLRSWAVDNSVIAAGTLIYAAQWDGISIPAIDGLGGFVHDGCFRADDVGGGIQGDHFDLFAGTYDMWQALEGLFPTSSTFDVYLDPGHCAWLSP